MNESRGTIMENTFSQFDESVIELQNVLRQTKQRKRGPNLTEQMRADIYQAHLEKVDQNAIAATYGLTLQTIKKASSLFTETEF